MSIHAKQRLIKLVENETRSFLTVDDRDLVVSIINNCLREFEVEEIAKEKSDSDTEEFLEEFLAAKKLEGRSDKTIAYYKYIMGRFLENAHVPISDISIYHLRSYMISEKKRGVSDRTLESYRNVFSSFFGWLHKEELLTHNPCANLGVIKYAKVIRVPYSDVDIEKLKESCESLRDKAIISFLLSTGCRISEVCSLNRDSIDFLRQECIVFGKGAKERVVFIDDVTIMLLRRYLDSRDDMDEALFVGRGNRRFQPNGVRCMLNRVADRAKVEHVHPHRFRRTLATNLIDHGMQIQDVASILGHERLDTTMKYVYMDKTNVRNAYRKYS